MKKGFTLVEMLIVIVVIAILMGMVMRFGNISTSARRRARTITRLQRIENALSGYYAAFGTYPPVPVHGSHDIYRRVSLHGLQDMSDHESKSLWGWLDSKGNVRNEDKEKERDAWRQVRAACKAQPVACSYPYSDVYKEYVQAYSDAMKAYVEEQLAKGEKVYNAEVFLAGFDTGMPPQGRFNTNDETWSEGQLFKFGLLSFLLPRYLFMMEGPRELFTDYKQWTGYNRLPHNPYKGEAYGNWDELRNEVDPPAYRNKAGYNRVASIPSQAACARWISNFEGSLVCSRPLTLFGVNLMSRDDTDQAGIQEISGSTRFIHPSTDIDNIEIYSPGGYESDSLTGQYVLNTLTIWDGWENEFFYYSPPPYQSYVVWSAGPNGRTFPPWIAREELSADANRCVGYWIADDIVGQKN